MTSAPAGCPYLVGFAPRSSAITSARWSAVLSRLILPATFDPFRRRPVISINTAIRRHDGQWAGNRIFSRNVLAQGTLDGCSPFKSTRPRLQDFYLKRYVETCAPPPAWFVDAVGPGFFMYDNRGGGGAPLSPMRTIPRAGNWSPPITPRRDFHNQTACYRRRIRPDRPAQYRVSGGSRPCEPARRDSPPPRTRRPPSPDYGATIALRRYEQS